MTSTLLQGKAHTSGDGQVPDIEDLCRMCDPLPLPEGTAGIATSFPMKVRRKKAREELDIVNVIEWRHDNNRLFLLVRRPEGGKLDCSSHIAYRLR
jgi:A/G-specific adenine glycosylase